jgi:lipoprotein NlpI
MAGRFAEAAADLQTAMELGRAPPDLALWRYVAMRRAGHDASALLDATSKRLANGAWPLPVVRYFQGAISGDALLAAAGAARDPKGRLCEAYFYLGEAALLVNQPDEARKLFQAALDTGKTRFSEYAGATAELTHLKAGDAPARHP